MNKLFNIEDSFESTNYFYMYPSRGDKLLHIPFKKEIFIQMYNSSKKFINGILIEYKSEIKTFEHPSGFTEGKRIVTSWEIVPIDKLQIYNNGGANVKREEFLISIPYHLIDILNVEYFKPRKG
jgi:hypothetical protein